MAKKTTTEWFCDRCKKPVERRNALIIEMMSFTASGYDDRGSGGAGHKDIEFCADCSRAFYAWMFNRKEFA